jgi:hypothetical protein
MTHRIAVTTLAALLWVNPVATRGQSQSDQLVGDGAIVAFHKQWRHPVTPYSSKGAGTPADIWIIRVDRWATGSAEGRYFLAKFSLYEHAVSDQEINQPLRFRVRKAQPGDGPQPCEGMTRVSSNPPFKLRPMRIGDFQQTESGHSDSIPPLKDLPCLIVEKPPVVVRASKEEPISVDGAVVATQRGKTDTRLIEPASFADLAEIYMVRVDDGPLKQKYIIVEYIHRADLISYEQFDKTLWKFDVHQASPEQSKDCLSWMARGPSFVPTAFGANVKLPDPKELPCFLMTKRPSVVRETALTPTADWMTLSAPSTE